VGDGIVRGVNLRRAVSLVFVWLALLAVPAAAQPDALQKAQNLFDDAQKALLMKDYDTAATKFKEAYDARPLHDLLYNVGTAYYYKGKAANDAAAYELAVQYYRKYLTSVPQATDKADVDKAIAIIEKEIARLKAPPAGPDAPPVAPSEEVQKLERKTRSLVVIETEPQGANIYLDDKKNGVFAQTPWSGSLDGQHKVIIEKRGHKSKESPIAPDPNRLVVLQVVLSEEDYLGWLEIRANVPGAAIYLDDKASGAIGKTPFSGNLKPGKHVVWVSADGYDETKHELEIIAGETHEIVAELSGSPVGYLDVRGSAGRVYVDGELLCERSPCRKPVKEGTHTIAISRGGYKTYRTRVDVQAKTELSVKPNLKPKPGRGDAIVAYIFSAVFLGGATYAYIYQGDLATGDTYFERKDQIKIGSYVGWGLGGVIGLSAVYYTFRDKGPPSTGQIDVRAVALEPVVGSDYAGFSLGGRF
jgi:tetratricopeptide (TPR) repeat protein